MEKARYFFEQYIQGKASRFTALPQSGSSRKNFVGATADRQYIITFNENLAENESFFYFSKVFSKLNLNTPKVLAISDDRKIYIQEYLADQTLSEIIEKEGLSNNVKNLVKVSLLRLFEMQQATLHQIDYSKTFEYSVYDTIPISNDLNYFKFLFVDILEVPYHKATLITEFRRLEEEIADLEPKSIMIRDFQARNIMAAKNEIYFIDYQSAMQGPRMYDVISFLYQAKANFPESFRQEMLEYFISLFKDEKEKEQLRTSIMPLRLIRSLQVLGAYGFRGLVQKKTHFKQSIGQGLKNLKTIEKTWPEINHYPELRKLIFNLNSDSILEKIHHFNNDINP